jgi:hypothetical protein
LVTGGSAADTIPGAIGQPGTQVLFASNNNGAADGRNARITYTVPANGGGNEIDFGSARELVARSACSQASD